MMLILSVTIDEEDKEREPSDDMDDVDDDVDDCDGNTAVRHLGARPQRSASATSRTPPCFISAAIKSPRPSNCMSAIRGTMRRPANPIWALTSNSSRSMFSS